MNSVVPKIDDQYWFEFSKTLLDSAVSRREKAADTLQKLVVWLWGIYTASATVGFSLSGKELDAMATALVAAASVALILVYWGTVWIQIPELVSFDPRSPTEIKEAFNGIVRNRNRKLVATLIGSIIAAILVSIALMVASGSTPPTSSRSATIPAIQTLISQDGSDRIISVTAKTGKAPFVDVRITPDTKDTKVPSSPIHMRLIPTDDGLIQTSTRINSNITSAKIQLAWTDLNGTAIQLGKDVQPTTAN